MNQYESPREMSCAMNGKMLLLMLGIMQVFSAVTSTAQYGINMFMIAAEAAKGTEDYVSALDAISMSILNARVVGVVFIAVGIVEIFVGVSCIILQNRLDKCFFTRKLIFILLGVEIVMNIFLFSQRLVNIGRLFSSLVMPLFLLWAVSRLCKLAKKYPDRVYAVDTKQKAAPAPQPAQKKSLRERAMVPPVEEDDPAEDAAEAVSAETASTEAVSTEESAETASTGAVSAEETGETASTEAVSAEESTDAVSAEDAADGTVGGQESLEENEKTD